ncbi:hypothetical protein EXIGLDRAFT_842756 [Exidia glandulosa HHB12029]|uniref:LYC1 C-terminal domain-containing protein n=1 Tax=Exidia glandulosa HHB12029 TaxID=1314781 RepID=A0A165D3J6_EXIGL|nr:hypothetical protein EXIGLDRAFT_842756 [Exidia glandulosa HHB12029]
MDPSLYTLFPATPEQVRESRVRTHPQWGRGVPLDEYLERDAKLDTFAHASDGRLTTWVLAPRDDPTTLDFLCACESYRREGFVRLPGDDAAREETMFGIASVYTPPRHRRKGAARHMMRLLHRVLAGDAAALPPFPSAWGSPPPHVPPGHKYGIASVLYSDVGAGFYSICGPSEETRGWEVHSPMGTVFDVAATLRLFAEHGVPKADVAYLALGDLEEVWNTDALLMKDEMPADEDGPVITFAPWRGVGAFQAHRNAFFLDSQGKKPLTQWGVKLVSKEHEPVYATWTMDVEVDLRTLIFTRIRCNDPEHFLAFLHAAAQTASAAGLRFIETWNLPEHLLEVATAYGGRTEARSEHLDSLAWYGPGEAVKWINNEKFLWC